MGQIGQLKRLKMITPFIVKESKGINFLLSIFLLLIFISLLFFTDVVDSSSIFFIIFSFIGALIYFIKGISSKIIFEINENGIYYYSELITNWDNYVNSYFKEEDVNTGENPTTDFFLYIEYIKPVKESVFISKILLSKTQNKSEEAILNAIKSHSASKAR